MAAGLPGAVLALLAVADRAVSSGPLSLDVAGVLLWGLGLGVTVTPLTAAVPAAVGDGDLGEASAISDVASRLGGAVLTALVPVLIGVQGGRGLAESLASGYRPAMIVVAGLCLVAAVSGIFVQDSRVAGPTFAAPAPHHGCALPDPSDLRTSAAAVLDVVAIIRTPRRCARP